MPISLERARILKTRFSGIHYIKMYQVKGVVIEDAKTPYIQKRCATKRETEMSTLLCLTTIF